MAKPAVLPRLEVMSVLDEIQTLLEHLQNAGVAAATDRALLAAACRFVAVAHRGMRRRVSSVPYIVHPLGVAALLAECGYGTEMVVAGLLHDVN
jgi:(p)ppGpp synthase/HD superfamily hydrolase